ncbi:MAG: glutathione-disulfide reductase [Nitrococcus mobilis]|nr:glutathione-disulfide reductase [Nitrococcus mobilis]
MARHFDLICIGGGSGGIAAARRAASYGARCAVVEQARLGGTCVNVGCVPKKIMWNAAHTAEVIERAADYGFRLQVSGHDWAGLVERREAYIERLNAIYRRNLERSGVELYESRARFIDPYTLDLGDEHVTAERFIIAVGGHPTIPDLPGAELGIDSDGFFALQRRPERVAVVGAGYIAVELSGVLRQLGSRVSLFFRRDYPLRHFDPMIRTAYVEAAQADGIELASGFVPASLEQAADGLCLRAADGRCAGGFEQVIWAVGRDPNTNGLGLEAADVELAADGIIPVDQWQATNQPHIFAIGDVTRVFPLTPVAIAAGRRLADRLWGGQRGRYLPYEMIPSVVFTHPPFGAVGLTEEQARQRYGADLKIYTTRFVPLELALSEDKRHSAMKLVCTGEQERIIGAHLFGAGVDEMLQGFAVAIRMGATKRDFDDTVAIHPTSAEELVTLT